MSACRRNLPWLLFPVLSGADLFLTWRLLGQGSDSVYESNPLAAWCLGHFGWPGLAAFKVLAVVVVLVATAAIYRRSPRLGAQVLTFGCTVLSAVVIYSFMLTGPARALDESTQIAAAVDAEPLYRAALPVRSHFQTKHDLRMDQADSASRVNRHSLTAPSSSSVRPSPAGRSR